MIETYIKTHIDHMNNQNCLKAKRNSMPILQFSIYWSQFYFFFKFWWDDEICAYKGVFLILSSHHGGKLSKWIAARKDKLTKIQLDPLSYNERDLFVENLLQEHGKSLKTDAFDNQLRSLVSKVVFRLKCSVSLVRPKTYPNQNIV